LEILRCSQLGIRQHEVAGRRLIETGYPGVGSSTELAVFILFGILAKIPEIPGVVLRVKGELRLLQLPFVDVLLEYDHNAYAVDHLGQVGDG
jgi:hypothetical protein